MIELNWERAEFAHPVHPSEFISTTTPGGTTTGGCTLGTFTMPPHQPFCLRSACTAFAPRGPGPDAINLPFTPLLFVAPVSMSMAARFTTISFSPCSARLLSVCWVLLAPNMRAYMLARARLGCVPTPETLPGPSHISLSLPTTWLLFFLASMP